MPDRPPPFALDAYDLGGARLLRIGDGDPAIPGLAAMLAASDPWQRLGLGAGALAAYLSRADTGLNRFRLVADGADTGLVCLRYPWLRGAYLELIGVTPGLRQQGAGGRLILWMAGEVRGRAGNLWATVSAFNARARTFYRRHGFVEVAPLPDLVSPGEDEILLRRRIG